MPTIAILASGGGTTAAAYIEALARGRIETTVGVVITNNPHAEVIGLVADLNSRHSLSIALVIINSKTHPDSDKTARGEQSKSEQLAIIEAVTENRCDAIVLMGYMKKIGSILIDTYGWSKDSSSSRPSRMLNTHPGPLPQTKGLFGIHVQEHVLNTGLGYSAQTLHHVAAEYDEGPIISSHKVLVQPGDTPHSLFERVKKTEKQHLPSDVNSFMLKTIHTTANTEEAV